MAAQILPFTSLNISKIGTLSAVPPNVHQGEPGASGPARRLHIVKPLAGAGTEQTALRIVEDVCLEHDLVHPAMQQDVKHSELFWATLPMPPARAETPLSVAKRLAHLILPMVELA